MTIVRKIVVQVHMDYVRKLQACFRSGSTQVHSTLNIISFLIYKPITMYVICVCFYDVRLALVVNLIGTETTLGTIIVNPEVQNRVFFGLESHHM